MNAVSYGFDPVSPVNPRRGGPRGRVIRGDPAVQATPASYLTCETTSKIWTLGVPPAMRIRRRADGSSPVASITSSS